LIAHIWTVLCSGTAIDSETNNISLFGVMEQLQLFGARRPVQGTVLVPTPMELVSLWERADWTVPARGTARIVVEFPDGHQNDPFDMDIDLSNATRHRGRVRFPAIPFRAPGVMRFVVSFRLEGRDEWTRVARVPLQVEVSETPQVH